MPTAITYLFVPGNRPERFAKALASGADCIIVDLEDAVALADKPAARTAIANWVASTQAATPEQLSRVWVRINDVASPAYLRDVALLQSVPLSRVMLPKCESADHVAMVCKDLPRGASILPLIETARGMVTLNEIAHAPSVHRLAFGALDYMVDLDIPADSPALGFAAAQIAIASRAAGLPAPVAGVTPALDAAQVTADTQQARALGFGAKMCIHPVQVAAVRQAFAPTAQELDWATRVLHAWQTSGGGALQLDGKMIDRPVVLKAERILASALPI
jgi:citrate lyase subunit beta/citryl-CoA lyase